MTDQPWIDPETVTAGAAFKERGLVAPNPLTAPVADLRTAQLRASAFLGEGSVPLADERDLQLGGPRGPIPCRLYRPDGVAKPPLLVYAHGGSFAIGALDGWDVVMRSLVRASGVAALSVDYRLAPEHKFPAGFEDMLSVIWQVSRNADAFDVDATRLAAGGDSAGANLALGAALALRDEDLSVLRFLLLIYGVYSTDSTSPAWQTFGTGAYGLSQAQAGWLWETYLESSKQRDDWRAAPLLADMKGLPPTYLTIGSLDPLLDDNHRLAEKLHAANVPYELVIHDGVQHGFIRYGRLIQTAARAVDGCAAALRKALAG
jgi:acetyl esterase